MVEWKELGELGKFENIGTDKKIIEGEKLVTLLNYVDVYHNKCIDSSVPQMVVSASDKKIADCTVEEGDIFVTPSSETVDDIGHSSVITETIPNAVYSYHIMRYRLTEKNLLLSYYINYAFDTENVKSQILKKAQGLTRFGLSKDKFASIMIPIPTSDEQTRIVGILDKFTNTIENLKQQIAERRTQYEYFLKQLLDLGGQEGLNIKTLGEIGKCVAGATPSTKVNSYWDNGNIPWMSSGEVHQGIVRHTSSFITQKGYDNASTKMLPINTIVIALAGQGKTRGSVAITAIELCTNQSLCGVVINDKTIINKYIYYYLKTRYDDLRRISSGDGTRGGLNLKMIGTYKVPVPSFSEQSRIVSILDTFEACILNLEKQLELRVKQYEYYRNKLLTFE